jgi:hypothetical protein
MYDTDWSAKWLADLHSNRWAKQVPAYEGVFTFGATEPVMTVLELRGFRMRDFFLMGDNADCGAIITPTESAANNIEVALEPAYRVSTTGRCRAGSSPTSP